MINLVVLIIINMITFFYYVFSQSLKIDFSETEAYIQLFEDGGSILKIMEKAP